jgi:hypothetical protein
LDRAEVVRWLFILLCIRIRHLDDAPAAPLAKIIQLW